MTNARAISDVLDFRSISKSSAVLLTALSLVAAAPTFAQVQPGPDQSPTQTARATPPGFADLVEGKLPAVVNISTTQRVPEGRVPQLPQLPPGLEEFFGDLFESPQPRQPRRMTALGSGFIVSSDGYVVTNNHVIENAVEITVVLQDDSEYTAKLVGRDPPTDIALLKIEPSRSLASVEWGDSTRLRPGDWVVAIGNPFGLGGSVTAGIISARARDIQAGPYDDFLQTDASINSGNSGGPLFAMDGRVAGVNTAIFSPTGGNIGIGFAVPSAIARPVVDELRQHGSVRRGWLGVQLQPITPELAQAMNLPDRRGALVTEVSRDSPAARAGLQPGDVIVAFDGRDVESGRELARAVAQAGPKSKAELVILRNGQKLTKTVELGQLPQRQASADGGQQSGAPSGRLGLQLAPLTPELRNRFGIPEGRDGAVVVGVAPGSPAAERGLQPGDLIVRVGDSPVDEPDDVATAVNAARDKGQKSVVMLVQRRDGSRFVPVPVG